MKSITLDFDNQKEFFLKDCTNKNKIEIVRFTSQRLDTFPQFIDFSWHYPDGSIKKSGQSPETFVTPYHRQPVANVPEDIPLVLEDVQYLKFALRDKGNCQIYFEEI